MTRLESQRRVQLLTMPDPFAAFARRLNPVFWLPLTEPAGKIAINAMYTSGQGPELLTNRDFSTGDLTGWTVSQNPPDLSVSVSGGRAVFSANGSGNLLISQPRMTVGDTYRLGANAIYTSGLGVLRISTTAWQALITSSGDKSVDGIASDVNAYVITPSGSLAAYSVDDVTLKKIGSVDGFIAGTTMLAQPGLRGPRHALLYDGATSLMTVYNRASLQGMTAFSLWALFNPTSPGENDNGTLFSKNGEFELRFNSSSRNLIATVNYGTTNAQVVTSTTLSANAWHSVGLRIDNTSKQIDLIVDGVEASYASEQSGVGSRVSNTNNLIVGNNAAINQTLAGLLDEVMVFNRALTANEFSLLHRLA